MGWATLQVKHLEVSSASMAEDLCRKSAIIETYVMDSRIGKCSLPSPHPSSSPSPAPAFPAIQSCGLSLSHGTHQSYCKHHRWWSREPARPGPYCLPLYPISLLGSSLLSEALSSLHPPILSVFPSHSSFSSLCFFPSFLSLPFFLPHPCPASLWLTVPTACLNGSTTGNFHSLDT